MKANPFGLSRLLTAFLLLTLSFVPVHAGTPACGPLAGVLEELSTKYHEAVLWQGRDDQGRLTLVTANPAGTTWTAMVVTGATVCLVDSGQTWTHGSALGPALGTEG